MKHLTRQEKKCQKERRALMAELDAATQALRANEKGFQEALDPLMALLEPVSGIALPLNRYTAFVAAVLGVPGVVLLLLLQLIL